MTGRPDATRRPCPHPLEPDVLVDYWMEALEQEAEDAVEEHLFGCDWCGGRVREIDALSEAVRRLSRSGRLKVVVGREFIQRAVTDGLRVREYAPPAGGSTPCTVAADDDLLVGRLAADLSGASRIDVSFHDAAGVELQRLTDIPFDPRSGEVVYQESITYAKGAPSNTLVARLLAVEGAGSERLLGEFTFNHTRTIPGPPAPH